MALIDSYRNTLSTKHKDLTKLLDAKAKEQKKISDNTIKINKANEAIGRTKSTSTIQSKLREISRCDKDLATCYKKMSEIEAKIGKKIKKFKMLKPKLIKNLHLLIKKER